MRIQSLLVALASFRVIVTATSTGSTVSNPTRTDSHVAGPTNPINGSIPGDFVPVSQNETTANCPPGYHPSFLWTNVTIHNVTLADVWSYVGNWNNASFVNFNISSTTGDGTHPGDLRTSSILPDHNNTEQLISIFGVDANNVPFSPLIIQTTLVSNAAQEPDNNIVFQVSSPAVADVNARTHVVLSYSTFSCSNQTKSDSQKIVPNKFEVDLQRVADYFEGRGSKQPVPNTATVRPKTTTNLVYGPTN